MDRRHWTKRPVTNWQPRPVVRADRHSFKPVGLWYEIDGGWIDWCSGEQPDWARAYAGHYPIEVTIPTRLLTLATPADVWAFSRRYSTNIVPHLRGIDWQRVARDHGGIEIRNYWKMSTLRFEIDLMWFYGWDCSSGCVWDLTAIAVGAFVPGAALAPPIEDAPPVEGAREITLE